MSINKGTFYRMRKESKSTFGDVGSEKVTTDNTRHVMLTTTTVSPDRMTAFSNCAFATVAFHVI